MIKKNYTKYYESLTHNFTNNGHYNFNSKNSLAVIQMGYDIFIFQQIVKEL